MVKNYIKVALRNFVKHKGYTFINVTGLAMGIACCLLIFLYVKDEFTYDQYHGKQDRIFRIVGEFNFSGTLYRSGGSTYPEAGAYLEEIPQVEAIVRVDDDNGIIQKGDDYIQETGVAYADPDIFEVFDFEVVEGTTNGAFSKLNQVVLTREMAMKLYDRTEVIGESLRLNLGSELETFYVTAVIENHPSNSSFDFNILCSWQQRESQLSDYALNSWENTRINSYLLLTNASEKETVVAQMRKVRKNHTSERENGGLTLINSLQALRDIHLATSIDSGRASRATVDPIYSYILSAIALVILVVGCINFTNLSLARSLPRVKEVGVRKVLGAKRKQLAAQFLSETLLLCLVAFVFGLVLSEMVLPVFGELTGKSFHKGVTSDPQLMFFCLLLVLFTAFLSGFYPSFVVSRFNPISSLKGKTGIRKSSLIAKSLLVLQFTIAAVLIVGTLTMNQQINFMIHKDLGYNDANLIRIDAGSTGIKNLTGLIKNRLSQNPNIVAVAAADDYKTFVPARFGETEFITVYNEVDDQYLELIETKLVKGRLLKKQSDLYISGNDTLENVLVNEAYVQKAGLEDILHKVTSRYRIVGVLKDFHYEAVDASIKPLMILRNNQTNPSFVNIFVKYKQVYLPRIESDLKDVWEELAPYRPFESAFVKEANTRRYEATMRWKRIITYASALAIAISIMGLFGLAQLATQQRIKEIGIRKVLGASLSQIVVLLNTNFSLLVLVSVVISTPIAYYGIDQWLQNFAYAIDITWPLFLIPGLITFTIAFVTVSLQSLRHASANPVDSLRYE